MKKKVFNLVTAPPSPLQTNDSAVALDHVPVLMVFGNPYTFRFSGVDVSNGNVTVTWQAASGFNYGLETSSNLVEWTLAATNLVASNATLSFTTNVSAAKLFFRGNRTP